MTEMELAMKNERKFWEKVLADSNRGWKTASTARSTPGNQADVDTFFYIVDAQSGWMQAAALTEASFLEVNRSIQEVCRKSGMNPGQIADCAATLLSEAARNNAVSNDEASLAAFNAVGLTLAGTRTFELVRDQSGGVKGHWMYLVYETKTGGTIGRPAYMSGDQRRFLHPAEVSSWIGQVIQHDINNPKTSVGRMLIESGGAFIHESLQPQTDIGEVDQPRG